VPVEKYFAGHGREVMAKMRKKYGDRAERVFYATANKRGETAESKGFSFPTSRRRRRQRE
jgi:hypothetical protein